MYTATWLHVLKPKLDTMGNYECQHELNTLKGLIFRIVAINPQDGERCPLGQHLKYVWVSKLNKDL